jgi:hypothetical protein
LSADTFATNEVEDQDTSPLAEQNARINEPSAERNHQCGVGTR